MMTAAIWLAMAALFCLDCSTVSAQDKMSPLYWMIAPLAGLAAILATVAVNQ